MWEEANEKLERLRSLDKCHQFFGASGHKYARKEPVSETRIKMVEKSLGAPLPEELRSYYLEVGDGVAGPDYGLCPIADLKGFEAHLPYPGLKALSESYTVNDNGSVDIDPEDFRGLVSIIDEGCSGEYVGRVVRISMDGFLVETKDPLLPYYHQWLDRGLHAFSFIEERIAAGDTVAEIDAKLRESAIAMRGNDLTMSFLGIRRPGKEPLSNCGNYQTPEWYEKQLCRYRKRQAKGAWWRFWR